MFNRLNIPKSLLDDVSGLLSETRKADIGVPEYMVEYVNKAAEKYPSAKTIEECRDIVAEEFLNAIKTQPGVEYTTEMVVKFEKAVQFVLKNSGKKIN